MCCTLQTAYRLSVRLFLLRKDIILELKGYVERVIYTNSENGHTILEVSMSSEETKRLKENNADIQTEIENEIVCVGTLYLLNPGEYAVFNGEFTVHHTYGLQFKVTSYEESRPEDMDAIEKYLGSGAIKGLGPALAGRIVRHFKMDTFRVIEETPEDLAQIKGISERLAFEIADQVIEKKAMRKAMLYLGTLGIGMNLAVKIYKSYGESLYTILNDNPYKLADDIEGVGFKKADEIARKAGIDVSSPYRIKSGTLYTLLQATSVGHTFYPVKELREYTENMLGTFVDNYDDMIMDLIVDKRIVVKQVDGVDAAYPYHLYRTETMAAGKLIELNVTNNIDDKHFEKELINIERRENLELDELQREAVRASACNGLLIITGGPGTGKTTTINAIIKYFELKGMEILLAAPTGRAAKRMTEATGYEAQTVHRLLELSGVITDDRSSNEAFERNEDNPLEADIVIIDEMSMVDIYLMNSLLKAIAVGTKLILVGDANQLPSVGPGNVLKDIIMSEQFETIKLTRIFRQSEAGDIVINAHKINAGEMFEIGPSSRDFPFIHRVDANAVISAMVTLVKTKLPDYTECSPYEVQILTPMRKGNLGVERLNVIMQQYLNPPKTGKMEKEINGVIFREGDKVMQIKNNYKITWEIRGKHGIPVDTGVGVFNGDTGVIDNINNFLGELTVRFDDDKFITYSFKELDELEHAYAVTVHKSQGSEYPAVVLPLMGGPRMLMNRNILYTAVTRARKCICVVGDENTFYTMISNRNEQKRYSSLALRIKEAKENA